MTVFKERVRELRPAYLPPDPAGRTTYDAGDLAQCDFWFPPTTVPVGYWQARTPMQLPVLTKVCGYSRWLAAVLIPSRQAEGRVRWMVAPDPRARGGATDPGVGRRGRGRALAVRPRRAHRRVSGVPRGSRCEGGSPQTREPEHKGIIERAHDYLERSFLPGRTFSGPGDSNHQLQHWLQMVNGRTRRMLGCAPTDRIGADRQAMLALPPVAPAVGWRSATRLARDHYVRLDSNDYSVHPGVIGRRIEVLADLDRVRVFCEDKVVADHERVWAWHQTITDPEHRAAADMLRRNRIGALRPVREPDNQISVEQQALADYDTALGIDLGEGGLVS